MTDTVRTDTVRQVDCLTDQTSINRSRTDSLPVRPSVCLTLSVHLSDQLSVCLTSSSPSSSSSSPHLCGDLELLHHVELEEDADAGLDEVVLGGGEVAEAEEEQGFPVDVGRHRARGSL